MTEWLLLAAATLATQPFSAGGIRQGMTRAEVAAVGSAAIAPDAREVEVVSDTRRYRVSFCGDRVHGLRSAPVDGVEWLSTLEWLHAQGFTLAMPGLAAWEDGKQERRELRQRLTHPKAPYRVHARMISLSSHEGAEISYQVDFRSTEACRAGRS